MIRVIHWVTYRIPGTIEEERLGNVHNTRYNRRKGYVLIISTFWDERSTTHDSVSRFVPGTH